MAPDPGARDPGREVEVRSWLALAALYPPDSPTPLEGEAHEAIEAARELLDAIVGTLPGELRPR